MSPHEIFKEARVKSGALSELLGVSRQSAISYLKGAKPMPAVNEKMLALAAKVQALIDDEHLPITPQDTVKNEKRRILELLK